MQPHRGVDGGLRTVCARGAAIAAIDALAHERQRLCQRERQRGAAELGQLAAGAQPGQCQPGGAARGGDQVQVRQPCAQQVLQERQRGGPAQVADAVQHQVDLARHTVEQGHQRRQQRCRRGAVAQRHGHGAARPDAGLAQARLEAGAQLARVVVLGGQRQPRHARAVGEQALAPLRQRGGLAIAGGRGQQHQPAVPDGMQALQQCCARDRAAAQARRQQPGRHDGVQGFHGRFLGAVRNRNGGARPAWPGGRFAGRL
ncbi:hypothetical protein D9M72_367820 [compost metagenome]